MRERVWSSVLYLVVIACLLLPALLFAADASSATAVDPNNAATSAAPANAGASAGPGSVINPTLVDLLVKKGILTTAEANSLRNASGSAAMEQLLILLKAKGVVNDAEAAELKSATDADTLHSLVDTESGPLTTANLVAGQAVTTPAPPPAPVVIPAIAPVRVLPIDAPLKDALKPAFTLGAVRVLPYGFIKSTMAYDSYQPYGDDFIKPLFLAGGTNSAPGGAQDFHIKARSTRFGSRFEWPDVSKNVTITGQIEGDFEGNFTEADNANVSSIRNPEVRLRLAYGRIDWQASPDSDIFFEAGQDWTIYGSSALMNLLETTFFGAYWGNVYQRSPQFRVGLVQNLGGDAHWKLAPEFAIMMPSSGDLPGTRITCPGTAPGGTGVCDLVNLGLASQIGYGEREGADSGRPEFEGRVVLQFQLDKAPGVVPAQILWSGFYYRRQDNVLSSGVPAAYSAAFPNGVSVSSPGYGNQLAVSLPTRWFTAVFSIYKGGDLRFMNSGQTLSYYNATGGLHSVADGFAVDYSAVAFGKNAAGTPVVASQLPYRGYGGFLQLGFPLSRWFNADPKGRNAGWQAYVEYGKDAVVANDFFIGKDIGAEGAGPIKSDLRAVTVFYKMNPWVQFGFEESGYRSFAVPAISGADAGICNGTRVGNVPVCNATDWRTEFGPIFTF